MISLSRCPLPGYEVRQATSADVSAIVDLDRDHMKEEIDKSYSGGWDEKRARSIVIENLARARVLVYNNNVVGTYYWWIEDASIAILHSIQISPAHRNKGLGTFLLACFEEEARSAGLAQAGLAFYKTNPVFSLYLRLGYRVCGEDGPDTVAMQKSLSANCTP